MLNILGMIILIIILFIILLLIIGIKISFEYNKKGSEFKGCLKILIFKKIKVYSHRYPSEAESDSDEDEEKEHEKRDIKKLFRLAKPCLSEFKTYLKSILKSISIYKIESHLIFGLDSFSDTGKYIGIIWGILSVVNSFDEKLKLSAEPSFTGSVIDVEGITEVEIYPLKLLVPTIRLISKKPTRKFIRGVLDER